MTLEEAHKLLARLFSPVDDVRRQAAKELHLTHGLHAEIKSQKDDFCIVEISRYTNQCGAEESPLDILKETTVQTLINLYKFSPQALAEAINRLTNLHKIALSELLKASRETIANLVWHYEYSNKKKEYVYTLL